MIEQKCEFANSDNSLYSLCEICLLTAKVLSSLATRLLSLSAETRVHAARSQHSQLSTLNVLTRFHPVPITITSSKRQELGERLYS